MRELFKMALLVAIISSCAGKSEETNMMLTTTLPDKIKTDAIELVGGDTVINQNMNIGAYSQEVYKDSVLIVWNSGDSGLPFLELRKLSDNSLIKSLFPKGNGPGELLTFQYEMLSKTKMNAMDVVKNAVMIIDIDSLINDSNYTFNTEKDYSTLGLNGPWVINGKLFYHNSYIYKNEGLDINVKGDKFILGNSIDAHKQQMEKYKYSVSNINQGFVVTNEELGRFAYFSCCQSLMELYNSDLKCLRSVEISDDLKDQRFIKSEFDNSHIFANTIPEAFTAAWSDANNIYVVYLGAKVYALEGKYSTELLSTPSYILHFDWDGNFIRSFRSDNYIRTISVSEDGAHLYANIFSSEGEPYVVKYPLLN